MATRSYEKKTSDEWVKQVIAASMLREDDHSQEYIANRLGIHQPKVSRLLSDAKERGWLKTGRDQFLAENVDESTSHLIEVARIEYLEDEALVKHVRGWYPAGTEKIRDRMSVKVCEDGAEFFVSAAHALRPMIERASLIGVMYGRTLAKVIHELTPERPVRVKKCIPVTGDAVYIMTQSEEPYSASWLAADLESRLTGAYSEEPSLTGVPAYIARRFLGKVRRTKGDAPPPPPPILDFVNSIPGNRRIFGRPSGSGGSPMVHKVDLLLTGLGIIREPADTGTFIRERLAQETDTDITELQGLIYGDVAGLLLPRNAKATRRVDQLNQGWTGISFANIELIARRAARDRAPGVVVIADAKEKAELIKALICQKGCVNTLIASHSLCATLKTL